MNYLKFLPKYNQLDNPKQKNIDVEDIKIGSTTPPRELFKYKTTSADSRGTANLATSQSASSIAAGGGAVSGVNFLNKIKFGKKKKAVFK